MSSGSIACLYKKTLQTLLQLKFANLNCQLVLTWPSVQ